MPPARSLGRAATWPTTRTPWSSSLGRPASTSWRAWRPLRAGLLCPTSPPTSTGRSSQPPRAPSTRPRRSGNIWPPRDARAPASLSRPVPSASPSREERSPLNLGARVGLYAMLAGLVLASFLVKPETAASKLAGPVASAVPAPARAELLARGATRAPRDGDRGPAAPAPSPSPGDDLVTGVADSIAEPPVAQDPEPEQTPEPSPLPAPRPPAPRPVAPVITVTTASAELRMLELMNASRARAGLTELAMDSRVAV